MKFDLIRVPAKNALSTPTLSKPRRAQPFGSRPKAFLRFDGQTLLERAVDVADVGLVEDSAPCYLGGPGDLRGYGSHNKHPFSRLSLKRD